MTEPVAQSFKIILFGGTFDPPHLGHQLCIDSTLEAFPKGKLIVMPTPNPPPSGATHQTKKPVASFTHRLAMCENAFLTDPRVTVSSLESNLPAPQYTYRTLEALKEPTTGEWNHQELAMIIGEDQFWGLNSWKNPALILALAQLIIISRPEGLPNQSPAKKPLTIHSALHHIQTILNKTTSFGLAPLQAPKLINAETCSASSSEIRTRFLAGESIPKDWIHTKVMNYIEQHKLYGKIHGVQ